MCPWCVAGRLRKALLVRRLLLSVVLFLGVGGTHLIFGCVRYIWMTIPDLWFSDVCMVCAAISLSREMFACNFVFCLREDSGTVETVTVRV